MSLLPLRSNCHQLSPPEGRIRLGAGGSRLAKAAELEESETAAWLVRTCEGGQPEAPFIIRNSIEVILAIMSWAYASGQRKRRLDAPPAAF